MPFAFQSERASARILKSVRFARQIRSAPTSNAVKHFDVANTCLALASPVNPSSRVALNAVTPFWQGEYKPNGAFSLTATRFNNLAQGREAHPG
jgi:hypothetical protein